LIVEMSDHECTSDGEEDLTRRFTQTFLVLCTINILNLCTDVGVLVFGI
jgi:hypothetical protein